MFGTHNSRHPTYLNLHLITCKALGFLNLHRIYRNLQKFTPLFEQFTKIYVNYSVNWICPPAPLFPGLALKDFGLAFGSRSVFPNAARGLFLAPRAMGDP